MRPVDVRLSPAALTTMASFCELQRSYLQQASRFFDSSCSRVGAFDGALTAVRAHYHQAYEATSHGLRMAQQSAGGVTTAVDRACHDFTAVDHQAAELVTFSPSLTLPTLLAKLDQLDSDLDKLRSLTDQGVVQPPSPGSGRGGTAVTRSEPISSQMLAPVAFLAESAGLGDRLRELSETSAELRAYAHYNESA